MAPEFFPFFFCAFLIVAIVIALVATVYVHIASASVPRFLGPLLRLGLVFLLVLLFVVGLSVRQQFFLNEPMASAAAEGDIVRVRALLDRGASPDSWGVDFIELT